MKSGSGSKGRGGGGAKSRKRGVISKVSYKELGSSEASSDDEDLKKTPKKKKRVSSDSDWDLFLLWSRIKDFLLCWNIFAAAKKLHTV